MQSIRVAIVVTPGMLRDILADVLNDAPDIEVVGHYDDVAELLSAQPVPGADVVVLGGRDENLGAMSVAFLERNPRAAVLAVAARGRSTSLVQLGPRRKTLGEVSADELVDAIRSSALPREWKVDIRDEVAT